MRRRRRRRRPVQTSPRFPSRQQPRRSASPSARRGGVEAEFALTGRRRHVETLTPALEHLLAQVGLVAGDLGLVVVDVGPGLFTGLRVGVAAAKGLAQSLGVGVLCATSLDVLGAAAGEAGHRGLVLACVDARRGEVFASVHEFDRRGDGWATGRPRAVCAVGPGGHAESIRRRAGVRCGRWSAALPRRPDAGFRGRGCGAGARVPTSVHSAAGGPGASRARRNASRPGIGRSPVYA